jgi:hypothetical protein
MASPRLALLAALVAACGIAGGAALREPALDETLVRDRPIEVRPAGYVSSRACQACHPAEHDSWRRSYHSTMTQVASASTALGDFDDVELRDGAWTFRLTRRDDELWADMPMLDRGGRPDGPRERRRIVLTTGSHHMQAYWYETGNTRVLGLLPFVFNRELGAWLPRHSSFLQPPQHGPVSEAGRWNRTCLECHATLGRLRPVAPAGQNTHVAEFGVACESCHGPAAAHVAANRSLARRYAMHLSGRRDPTIVQPRLLAHDRSSEVCGQCHSTSIWTDQESIDAWMARGFDYRPGDRLADTKHVVRGTLEANTREVRGALAHQPELLSNTFWSDGMTRVAGREYNMLLETACFVRGELSCLSCHEMHRDPDDPRLVEEWADDQLKPGMRGNDACTQCHGDYADDERLRDHTHHEPGSAGSVCYNCHMPYTTYGLLKAIRSHQVSAPSVAATVATGRPLACNQCHLDRTLGWSGEWLEAWYRISPPPLSVEQRSVSATVLAALRGDAGQRALAAWSLGWDSALAASGSDWQALYLGVLLDDPYDAVRHIARRSLAGLPRSDATPSPRAGLLLDARGRPDRSALLELLAQRDDTPIRFAE